MVCKGKGGRERREEKEKEGRREREGEREERARERDRRERGRVRWRKGGSALMMKGEADDRIKIPELPYPGGTTIRLSPFVFGRYLFAYA